MLLEAIHHLTDSNYAHAIDEETVVIRLRAKKGDIKQCVLFYGDRASYVNPVITEGVIMHIAAADRLFDYFEVELKCDYKRICYYFFLDDGITSIYYYGGDFSQSLTQNRSEFFQFPCIRREDIAAIPDWAVNSIIYQIFPDSFATSERFISKSGKCIEKSELEKCYCRNGGTLQGIIENIPYLVGLGINCLYLTPIFTAVEYHKYDTIDYFSIDPGFGDKETFKRMVKLCHENNIKVILDGVFNHSGSKFFAFQDVLENGENSKYKDWYYKLEFPVKYGDPPNYDCFAYVKDMPKLNTGNQEVIDYFCKVGTYWIEEADIDGWRLDVANEVDHNFWRCFRKAVRAVKPDCFLIGEIWEDSHSWLLGDQFDSTMNYRFSNVCKEYFAEGKISLDEFDTRINSMLMRYKKNVTLAQMNLLDSHDVPRFLSYCKGDIRKLKLAALFMLTFQGVPSILYGNEKGISGVKEYEYRSPMVWEDNAEQAALYDYFKRLIAIRKQYNPLICGDFKMLMKDIGHSVYAYARQSGSEERVVIVLNNSEYNRTVLLPIELLVSEQVTDILTGMEYVSQQSGLKIEIPPISGVILIRGK